MQSVRLGPSTQVVVFGGEGTDGSGAAGVVLRSGAATLDGATCVVNKAHPVAGGRCSVLATVAGADVLLSGGAVAGPVTGRDTAVLDIVDLVRALPPRDQRGLPPVILVSGTPSAGKSTLHAQLAHTLSQSRCGGPAPAVLAVTTGLGGAAAGAVPGAVVAHLQSSGGPPMQPLSFFHGAVADDPTGTVRSEASAARLLDVCAFLAQGTEVLVTSSGDGSATVPAAVVVDCPSAHPDVEPSLSTMRSLCSIFRAALLVIVGPSRREAADLGHRIGEGGLRVVSYAPAYGRQPRPSAAGTVGSGNSTSAAAQRAIHEYLCGTVARPLAPVLQVVNRADILCLDATTLALVELTAAHSGTLACVPFPAATECLSAASAAGFVMVRDVGDERISLVCPCRGPLPSSVLLLSAIQGPPTLPVHVF